MMRSSSPSSSSALITLGVLLTFSAWSSGFASFENSHRSAFRSSARTWSTNDPISSSKNESPQQLSSALLDEEAYEKDRLSKDAQAIDAMKAVADMEFAKGLRTPWKWKLRKRIWDYMEENDIARFPRPVHHRIPNFVGAEIAAARLADLPEYQTANMVKSNPDTPQ